MNTLNIKDMSQKQLQEEFCKVENRTNDIYKAVGYETGERQLLLRDRNDCWQASEKIRRQPRLSNVTEDCPGLVRMSPIEAAIEKAKLDRETSNLKLKMALEK